MSDVIDAPTKFSYARVYRRTTTSLNSRAGRATGTSTSFAVAAISARRKLKVIGTSFAAAIDVSMTCVKAALGTNPPDI